MLRNILKILPVFIAHKIAEKYCERVVVHKQTWCTGFDGVLFKVRSGKNG